MVEFSGIKEIIKPENLVYKKTNIMTENILSYCPGCGHGTTHRILAEIIDEEGLQSEAIGVSPVGCSVFLYYYLDIDWQEAAHGRAPAVATAIKRLQPEKFVFTYQGDGDLAAIGTAETIHACNRGENILIIFINNGIYGMTGGQMAPTTLPNQITTTSPYGRNVATQGEPIRMSELLATVPGSTYIERVTVIDPTSVRKAKKAIKHAFEVQRDHQGFSMIEVLSTCNIGWGKSPIEALGFIKDQMIPYYPLGVFKDKGALK